MQQRVHEVTQQTVHAGKLARYLGYISQHCRWMTEVRPNGKGGFWRAKNLDYLITDECYTAVKEDRANDRK